uniref:Uncharacterized protein n=1 Tax=Pyrodinium bahamense TaxID=73915 RepID=A0A7S0FW54_9DINO|mmetsp:Transcript_47842/g.132940  ORF Transcript_47842/g.132940 Transcript_47842/m.132940 type:complete len:226 (+) Transcript_47842:106-783(+)
MAASSASSSWAPPGGEARTGGSGGAEPGTGQSAVPPLAVEDARQSVAQLLAQLQPHPSSRSAEGCNGVPPGTDGRSSARRRHEAMAARLISRVDALIDRQESSMRNMMDRVDDVDVLVRAATAAAAPGTPSTGMPESSAGGWPDSEAEELEPIPEGRLGGTPSAAGEGRVRGSGRGASGAAAAVRAEDRQASAGSSAEARAAAQEDSMVQLMARLQAMRTGGGGQ